MISNFTLNINKALSGYIVRLYKHFNVSNLLCCIPMLIIHMKNITHTLSKQIIIISIATQLKLNWSMVAMAILQNDNLGSNEVEWLCAPTLTSSTEIKTRID